MVKDVYLKDPRSGVYLFEDRHIEITSRIQLTEALADRVSGGRAKDWTNKHWEVVSAPDEDWIVLYKHDDYWYLCECECPYV